MDVIGLRMKAFQDMYEVTDNLGEAGVRPQPLILFQLSGLRLIEKRQSWAGQGGADECRSSWFPYKASLLKATSDVTTN